MKKKLKTLQKSRSILLYFAQKLPRIFNKLTRKNAFQARKLFGNFEKWTPDPLKENCCSLLLLRMFYTDSKTLINTHVIPHSQCSFYKSQEETGCKQKNFLGNSCHSGETLLDCKFSQGKTFVKNRKFASGMKGSIPGLCSRDLFFRLVLFLGFNSSTIRTACSSPEKNHCSLHETRVQV